MSQPTNDANRRQEAYREAAREFDQAVEDATAARAMQRTYTVGLLGGIALTFLLGYTVVVGLWKDQPLFTRYFGLATVLVVWVAMGRLVLLNRKKIVDLNANLRNLLHARQSAAAALPLDSEAALRIYREASLDDVQQYRKKATRNRQVHNLFQVVIIVGSIVVSTLSAMSNDLTPLTITATVISAVVGASAGLTGYFKFRERGFNLQSTADEIEKHYKAVQFRFGDYENISGTSPEDAEKNRLRKFAEFVEKIKDEQRKRELQLEQSPESNNTRA
ncbi:DUF4231 domain-containing protein [Embleya sp. NPDC059259]|uniref:DUF4231 domain-containing protein n=1 Tax=unclassified Embleya TaxID=2699296 RepID=UPI00369C433B